MYMVFSSGDNLIKQKIYVLHKEGNSMDTNTHGKTNSHEWSCLKCIWCCEYFPMNSEFVNSQRNFFQKPVREEFFVYTPNGKEIVIVTDTPDRACVF
jgi:hypothetical protein